MEAQRSPIESPTQAATGPRLVCVETEMDAHEVEAAIAPKGRWHRLVKRPFAWLAIAFVVVAAGVTVASLLSSPGYQVNARFENVDGLSAGDEVRIGGVKIGKVTSTKLDTERFDVLVRLKIAQDVRLPLDTVAEVRSAGILGTKYVGLIPGAEPEAIAAGGEIEFTETPLTIESLIGQAVFGKSPRPAPAFEAPSFEAEVPTGGFKLSVKE